MAGTSAACVVRMDQVIGLKKVKVSSYIEKYPVVRTAQGTLYLHPGRTIRSRLLREAFSHTAFIFSMLKLGGTRKKKKKSY